MVSLILIDDLFLLKELPGKSVSDGRKENTNPALLNPEHNSDHKHPWLWVQDRYARPQGGHRASREIDWRKLCLHQLPG